MIIGTYEQAWMLRLPFEDVLFREREINMAASHLTYKERESGIEALKILAIIMIMISHVSQSLLSNKGVLSAIDVSHGAESLQYFTLVVFRHFGAWGNNIFFSCSAWFLLSSKRWDKRKWFFILFEVWTVSVAVLACTIFFVKEDISARNILRSFLPTFFGNNEYLTLYLLFYPIHPILNGVICRMEKAALFRLSSVLFVLYCGFSLVGGTFFYSSIIGWIAMYFVIAYCKEYLRDYLDSIRLNSILLAVCMIGLLAQVSITNFIHLHSYTAGKMFHWAANNNPFLFLAAFSMLQIARKWKWKNAVVNYISGLSLLLYIFHENLVLRTYIRPKLLNYIYLQYGYSHVVAWVVLLALGIFAVSIVITAVYREVFQKYVKAAGNMLFDGLRGIYLAVEGRILRIPEGKNSIHTSQERR